MTGQPARTVQPWRPDTAGAGWRTQVARQQASKARSRAAISGRHSGRCSRATQIMVPSGGEARRRGQTWRRRQPVRRRAVGRRARSARQRVGWQWRHRCVGRIGRQRRSGCDGRRAAGKAVRPVASRMADGSGGQRAATAGSAGSGGQRVVRPVASRAVAGATSRVGRQGGQAGGGGSRGQWRHGCGQPWVRRPADGGAPAGGQPGGPRLQSYQLLQVSLVVSCRIFQVCQAAPARRADRASQPAVARVPGRCRFPGRPGAAHRLQVGAARAAWVPPGGTGRQVRGASGPEVKRRRQAGTGRWARGGGGAGGWRRRTGQQASWRRCR